MKDRIQLNLRLDGQRELYEAVKEEAHRQGVSINQYVLGALRSALGWEVDALSAGDTQALAERLAVLKEKLVVLPSLVERLAGLEERLGKPQRTIA